MRIQSAAYGLPFLAALLALVGCGDGMSEVSGTIQFDGKAIDKGSIGFIPIDGKGPTTGGEIKDGKYSVRVPLGNMKVEIRSPKVTGKKKDYDAPGGKWYETSEEAMPPKYNNQTELRLEVVKGKNAKDWDLHSK